MLNGPPGPSVDSFGVGASSTNDLCSDGGKTVVAVRLVRTVGSRSTVIVPRAVVCSEGRRDLALSSRFFRLSMVFTSCLSSRSDRAGTNFIIVLASSFGWGGFDRRRWAGRNGSFTSLGCSVPDCVAEAPCASENVLFGGTRRGGLSAGAWIALFDWVSTISFA